MSIIAKSEKLSVGPSTKSKVSPLSRVSRRLVVALTVPIVVVIIWQLVTQFSPSLYWPTPIEILGNFSETWFEGRLTADVLPSLSRLILGFGAALLLGVVVGLFVGMFRRLRLTFEPVFELFRAVPPPVLVPVVMLFTGIGHDMQVTVIAFGCFWPILINTVEGIRGVELTQLDTARAYKVIGLRRILAVLIPAAAPKIVAGARQALSIGIIMMVISEMFASTNGIGFNVIEFQRLFKFTEMWTGIVLLGVIGVAANSIFKFIERRVLRWYLSMQLQER